jgi:hypothetical protein
MVYIQNNAVNQVWLGINEWSSLSNPTYLFQLENSQGRDSVYFIPRNITANYPDSYANKYLVFEFETFLANPIQLRATGATDCNIHLKNENQYWLYIWEQPQGDGNLNPLLATNKVFNELAFIFVDENNTYYTGNTANFADNVIYYSQGTTPPPSPSPSPTPTPSITPTTTTTPFVSPSMTPTITSTNTSTPTTTPTLTPTITPSVSPSLTPTNTLTPTPTPSTSGIPNFCVGAGLSAELARGNYLDGNDLYIFGGMEFFNLQVVDCVFKLDKNSGVQQTFQPAFPNGFSVNAMTKKSTGDFYMTGSFNSYSGQTRQRLVKLQPDLYMAPAFDIGSGLQNDAFALHYNESTDRLFVGGGFVGYNLDTTKARFIKIDGTTGAIDTSIPNTYFGNGDVGLMVSDGNGNLFLGGTFTTVTGTTGQNRLVYVSETNGYRVPGFNIGTGFNQVPHGAVYDGVNNRLYVVGQFTLYNGVGANGIVCLNATTGAIDTGFVYGTGLGGGFGISITQLPGGDLVILHNSAQYNGVNSSRITRVSSGGTMDNTFQTNIAGGFSTITLSPRPLQNQIQNDGTYLYITGNYIQFAGQNFNGLVRLNIDGTLASTNNC